MPKKYKLKRAKYLTPPKLDNNPVWDSVVTSLMPMLSFTNGEKGVGDRTYSVQLSKVSTFNYKTIIEYENVREGDGETTSLLVDIELEDKTEYYWRVSVADEEGNHTDWVLSRFYVDTDYCIVPSDLSRLSPANIDAPGTCSFAKATNVMDMQSFWHSEYGAKGPQIITFDFGFVANIAKIWTMSDPNVEEQNGWLIDFCWEKSNDNKNWVQLDKTVVTKNRTGRLEFDFDDLNAQFLRLVVNEWVGMSFKINDLRFYTSREVPVPELPKGDYILVVGTEQDGSTQTALIQSINKQFPHVKTVLVPFYNMSMDYLNSFKNQPKAIIFSSNSVDYAKVPIFEYIGTFDIIRNCDIPTLGIGAGMHLQYLSYCTTYARRIGYKDIDVIALAELRKKEKIFVRQKDSPLLADVVNKFTTVETSFWEVVDELSEVIEYETLADLDYPMVVKNRLKEMYGVQFAPEIDTPFNQAQSVLGNFINLALDTQDA
jgi:anthranilate/para-aminobenzoate synthase component II